MVALALNGGEPQRWRSWTGPSRNLRDGSCSAPAALPRAENGSVEKISAKAEISSCNPAFFCYNILAAWCGRLKWPL